jgi:hypothetical protein
MDFIPIPLKRRWKWVYNTCSLRDYEMGKPHQLQRRNSGIYAQGVDQGARGKHKPGSKYCKNYDEELIKKNCFYGTHAGYCRSSGTYSILPFQEMLFLHFFASFY